MRGTSPIVKVLMLSALVALVAVMAAAQAPTPTPAPAATPAAGPGPLPALPPLVGVLTIDTQKSFATVKTDNGLMTPLTFNDVVKKCKLSGKKVEVKGTLKGPFFEPATITEVKDE